MDRNSFTSDSKIPLGFLAFLGITILVYFLITSNNAFWQFCEEYTPVREGDNLRFESNLRLLDNDSSKKIVFVGRSTTREGFDMNYLRSVNGKKDISFYNLGYAAASTFEIYTRRGILLKENSVVVYMLPSSEFERKIDYDKLREYAGLESIPLLIDAFGTIIITTHFNDLTEIYLGNIFVFYRHRADLVRLTKDILQSIAKTESLQKQKNFRYDNALPQTNTTEKTKKTVTKNNTNLYEYQIGLLELFLQEAKNKNCQVIIVDEPQRYLTKLTKNKLNNQTFREILLAEQKKYGFKYLQVEDLPRFDTNDFYDSVHLLKKGRDKLTKRINAYLSANGLYN